MTIRRLVAAAALAATGLFQAPAALATGPTDSNVTSWLMNTGGVRGEAAHDSSYAPRDCEMHHAVCTALTDVRSVCYDSDYVYVAASGIPSYDVGPFGEANPAAPVDVGWHYLIPATPIPAPSGGRRIWPLYDPNSGAVTDPGIVGPIGVFLNGVPLFSPWDGNHAVRPGDSCLPPAPMDPLHCSLAGVWNQNAPVVEESGFDPAFGHPANYSEDPVPPATCCSALPDTFNEGEYHHHQRSPSLAEQLGDVDPKKPSPIVGYAFDGYPIYGPYAYKNCDGSGGVVSMRSSYQPRMISVRDSLPDGTHLPMSDWGPLLSDPNYALGTYIEDYKYMAGSGDLDESNGRWCPGPGGGTYAYYTTIDPNTGENAFPYAIGKRFHGVLDPAVHFPFLPDESLAAPASASCYQPFPCGRDLWTLVQTLTAGTLATSFGHFASDVSISGDLVAAGAPDIAESPLFQRGVVFAFRNHNTPTDPWKLEQVLDRISDGSDIRMGRAVSVDPATIITGDELHRPEGGAFLFQPSGTSWSRVTPDPDTKGSLGDDFGHSVAVEDDIAVVGAPSALAALGPCSPGAVDIFNRTGSSWSLEQTLYDDFLHCTPGTNSFGSSVAIDGGRILVGNPGKREAYLYERSGGSWMRTATFPSSGFCDDNYGVAVDICGDRVVVGSPQPDCGCSQAYVYRKSGGTWSPEQRIGPLEDSCDHPDFGWSVSISDETIVVGAPQLIDQGPGEAFVYQRCDGSWRQSQVLDDPDPGAGSSYALHVDVDGDWIAVGAHTRSAPFNPEVGAAYLYRHFRLLDVTALPDFGGPSDVLDVGDSPGSGDGAAAHAGGTARRAGVDVPVLWTQVPGGTWVLQDLSDGEPLSGRVRRLVTAGNGSVIAAGAIQGSDAYEHPTLWTLSAGAWQPSTLPLPPGLPAGEVRAVVARANGTVAAAGNVRENGTGILHAALWTGSGPVLLPGLAASGESGAEAMVELARGSLLVVGWATSPAGVHRPVRWVRDSGEFVVGTLPPLPGSRRGEVHDLQTWPDGRATASGDAGALGGALHPVLWSLDAQGWTVQDKGLPSGAGQATFARLALDPDLGMSLTVGAIPGARGETQGLYGMFGCSVRYGVIDDLVRSPSSWLILEGRAITPSRRIGAEAVSRSAPNGPVHAVVLQPAGGAQPGH